MWVAFYLPWAVTIAHPAAGFLTTTLFMVYHYAFHREIVQRIELSVLSNPVKIFEPHYQKHHNGQTNDTKAKGSGKTQPGEGQTQMETDVTPSQKKSNAREASAPKEVSPYVWDYATW